MMVLKIGFHGCHPDDSSHDNQNFLDKLKNPTVTNIVKSLFGALHPIQLKDVWKTPEEESEMCYDDPSSDGYGECVSAKMDQSIV